MRLTRQILRNEWKLFRKTKKSKITFQDYLNLIKTAVKNKNKKEV